MKKLLAYFFKWPLVYTKDLDGEIRLRRVKKNKKNQYIISGVLSSTTGILASDGTIRHGIYLREWYPANKQGIELQMLFKLEN